MGLNMYLGETEVQKNSMNSICIEIIQAMEQSKSSINAFTLSFSLQGKTYNSAKMFMSQTYLPLAQGIIYLCEELIRQNDQYISDFKGQVASTDVIEYEVREQIQEIERMKANVMDLNDKLPLFEITITIYNQIKRSLERKLEHLYEYNSASGSNYDTAMELANSVVNGLTQVQAGKGFNSKTGLFSTEGMNLDWITQLEQTYYTRKAKEGYRDYLKDHPQNINKVVDIITYEEAHPEHVVKTNGFLSPLEERDVIGIKYLMYTAEEPYRLLGMQYLDRLEITSLEGKGSFFSPDNNTITYLVDKDRTNERGEYFTFFHELGHAAEYNYGMDNGMKGYYSDSYESNQTTLAGYMHEDVKNRVHLELNDKLDQSKYNTMDEIEKAKMMDTIMNTLIYNGPTDIYLTSDEMDLYKDVSKQLKGELQPNQHNTASDVYGGVTLNQIKGKWAHHNDEYWIHEETGERKREPNREGFASYYGSIMMEDGELRDQELASINEYLPNSKQHMDDMLESMNDTMSK